MPRQSGVYIEGLRETVRDLERLGVEVADLKELFTRIGEDIAAQGRRIVPTDSGRLLRTIKPAKAKNKAIVRAGSRAVPYAGVINYGWQAHGIRRTDFLTDPANNDLSRHIQTLEEGLQALIDKYHLGATP